MPEKLDKDIVLALLAEADIKWYQGCSGQSDYRGHLKFTAEYIVKNYNKELKKGSRNGT